MEQRKMPELRNIKRELKELEKSIDTRFISEKELAVLNMLPIEHELKVMLYEELVANAQRKHLKRAKTIEY